MDRPFFSVIITTYNRAGLLRMALKSLKAQSFRDFEVLVYDDASTDNTNEVFETFKNEKNWHFTKLDKNRGYPYSKNQAFRDLKGKYVTFLDSDDVWLPDRLLKFHEFAVNNPSAGFIFSNGYIHQDSHVISRMFGDEAEIPSGNVPAYMAVSNHWLPYVTTNVAIKREAVDQAGFYREEMAYLGDTEYFARVIKSHPVGVIREPLSIYRIHEISLTQNRDKCIEESLATLDSTQPPQDIRGFLHDLIYFSQAVVLIKNGQCAKAREYLDRIVDRGPGFYKTYVFTFIPQSVLAAARAVFKKLRIAKLALTGSKDLADAERFLASL